MAALLFEANSCDWIAYLLLFLWQNIWKIELKIPNVQWLWDRIDKKAVWLLQVTKLGQGT